MRLLLLIPAFLLIAISGYNLTGGYSAPGANEVANNSITPEMLHMGIILFSVVFISFIVRSLFAVKYIETEMPQTAPRFYQRLAQQLHL
ncbi:MAG: hypothetical protein V4581_02210 [Bacteroidota bacterium]